MVSFFGTPWQEVNATAVESFLAEAGDEGVLWEAKGHSEPHRDAVRKAVCGLANAEGGFFIVGAERPDKNAGWQLPGVEFRASETATVLGHRRRPEPAPMVRR